jgi:1,2-phenylacetyl-CoA epoxidase PaaB subunit
LVAKQREVRLETAEMKFMRRAEGYSLIGNRRSEVILEVEKKLAKHKQKWLNHVSRAEDIKYLKQLEYRPIGRRNAGRRELQDGFN